MIIYKKSKIDFLNDIQNNDIADILIENFRKYVNKSVANSEISSWRSSINHMAERIRDSAIPNHVSVAIEFCIPRSNKRVDFIVAGQNINKDNVLIIIELKQWDQIEVTNLDAIVKTKFRGRFQEVVHPSYQAWSYSELLASFNEFVYNENVQLKPCAYMHNYKNDGLITHNSYSDYIKKAPLYCKEDKLALTNYLIENISYPDNDDLISKIDNSPVRPSKNLSDSLLLMLEGKNEFIMIDAQKQIFEKALHLSSRSSGFNKNVLIVLGGPGTGKSVIAINLLVNITKNGLNALYVTKNSAPRKVYESKLTSKYTKTKISNMFVSSGSFVSSQINEYDALIVDEAHRLNEKSGFLLNLGENQIKEIINSAYFSIFFLDEDQIVTLKDIGSLDTITQIAGQLNTKVTTLELTSQFRCNGSDGYLAWLDNTLKIKETANIFLDKNDFDFKIFDNPNELRKEIINKNTKGTNARIVAGYCWDWQSKTNPEKMDIVIPEYNFQMQWNLGSDSGLWIVKESSIDQAGCIHTCQGLEIEYIGVIIGPDLIYRDNNIICIPEKRSVNDRTIMGYKKQLKKSDQLIKQKLDKIIKNTYKTLMTRGSKGCYLFCTDDETRNYFKTRLLEN